MQGKSTRNLPSKLNMKKRGPCMVYSGDLIPSDENVRPVYDKIPIVELTEGQELEFEVTAILGMGKEHAKWQASVVGYRNIPKITIDKGGNESVYAERCPRHVFVFEEKKLRIDKILECNLCMQCVDLSKGVIKVEPDETNYLFNVETTCGLKPKEIVLKSVDILLEKLDEFSKDLSKLK